MDFTNLNQACPKDYFLFPIIDQLVDATARFEYLSSLDAYLGYHQIPINPKNEEKIAFVIYVGTFCYKVIPFNLENASATYHRMVTKVFKGLIRRNMEVHLDDMLVKSLSFKQNLKT